MKTIGSIMLVLVLAGAAYLIWATQSNRGDMSGDINSYEECVAAGYPVMESYPPQCKTPDGKNFTQDIGNEMEHSNMIHVNSPRPNAVISSPLQITGEARGGWYFEASFPLKLVDGNGNLIAEHYAQAQAEWMTENFVPFTSTLNFATPTTPTGTLIINNDNPSGLPENSRELRIPVKFNQNAQSMAVKVYWGNSNENDTSCKQVEAVTRVVPKTDAVARAALMELIKGPTQAEQGQALFSSLPQNAGVEIKSLRIENGTAYIDFNSALETGVAGSCRVTHIRSQIESTLKQFPTVKSVTISVNGRTEDILQP